MTPDERWYEAVKLMQRANELLGGEMSESVLKSPKGDLRQVTITYDESKLETTTKVEE